MHMAERKTRRRGYVTELAARFEEAGDQVMRAWRTRAKRRDPVGDVSYRGLEAVHGGLKVAIRSLSRLEEATQPPHRAPRHEPHPQPAEAETERPARTTAATRTARPRPRPQPRSPATTTP